MPWYYVEAIEKFRVRTCYFNVEAQSADEAVERCKSGKEAYCDYNVEEGDEEWLETVSVELDVGPEDWLDPVSDEPKEAPEEQEGSADA